MAQELERFSVSMEKQLVEAFDAKLGEKGYPSRSEALRDLMRGWLNDAAADEHPKSEALGTLTLFYDHTQRDLAERLTALGHEHHHLILTTLHFHVDHERCLEVLALKGPVALLRGFADAVIAMKGIVHGKLVLTLADASGKPRGRKPTRHSHGPGHWHTHG